MNKETLQSYNTRLNKNNISLDDVLENINKLPEISGTLEITENGTYDVKEYAEAVVNVEGSSSGGNMLNIFTQETEPSTKDGIWLQTSEKYDSVSIWEIGTEWIINPSPPGTPYTFNTGHGAIVGNCVYIFGGDGGTNMAYKYDIINKVYTKLPNIPWNCSYTRCVVKGTDIYVAGSWSTTQFGKFDTITETFTALANSPIRLDGASITRVGDFIYTFGGNQTRAVCKYDIVNNMWSTLAATNPETFLYGDQFAVGTDIYFIAPSVYNGSTYAQAKNNYKFDTITENFVILDSPAIEDFRTTACVEDGDNIYLFGGTITDSKKAAYLFKPSTNTAIKLDEPVAIGGGAEGLTVRYNDQILIFSQSTGYSITRTPDILPQYFKNTVKICLSNSGIPLVLLNYPSNLLGFDSYNTLNFNDIDYYSKENEATITAPIYYGDGTQWVKFKN